MSNRPDDLVPVTDFMLECESNLIIAHAVHAHYVEARASVLRGFFSRLQNELSARLSGWRFQYDPEFFKAPYGIFMFCKPEWNWNYSILVEAYDRGKKMVYGVWRNEDMISKVPKSSKLLAAVRAQLPQASSRKWYEAEIAFASPAADWRKPEVLWRIHSDDAFRREVAALLFQVVDLTETHIDGLVASIPRRK